MRHHSGIAANLNLHYLVISGGFVRNLKIVNKSK